MKPNYSVNKRRREEAQKKKQEEKRNRRLNKSKNNQTEVATDSVAQVNVGKV